MGSKTRCAWQGLLLACVLTGGLPQSAVAATDGPGGKTIRVAIDDNYPPYAFRDSTGTLRGLLVDAWELWEQKTGVRAALQATDWKSAQQQMEAGGADVLETAFRTPLREKLYDFSPAYAEIPVGIYVDADVGGIADIDSLRGFLVGAKAGDACVDRLHRAGIGTVHEAGSYEGLVEAALQGRIKVFCLDVPPANYLLYRERANHRFRLVFTLYTGQLHRAVHKGDGATLALVNRGFAAIPADEMGRLEKKWKGPGQNGEFGRHVVAILAASVGIGLLLVLWSLSLRRQVQTRTEELHAERNHLRTLIETLPDAIWLKTTAGVIAWCNPAYARLLGRTTEQIVGHTDTELFREAAKLYLESDKKAIESGKFTLEETFFSKGKKVLLEVTKTPVADSHGATVGVLGVAHDITERERNRDVLQRSLRALRLLSDVNQVLIRCESEEDLLARITENLVTAGGFVLAWVGYARDDAEKTVEPVAQAGFEDGYLSLRRISWGDNPFGQSISGRAIRSGMPAVNRDYRSEDMQPWRDEARRRGYRSSLALPLLADGQTYGVLNLYAAEENGFDDGEVALLAELAGDLAFGIRTLRQRRAHQSAMAALRSQTEILEMVATGCALESVLETLLRNLEMQIPGAKASILLVTPDGRHLGCTSAPNLPDSYNSAIDGLEIRDGNGCCGTAAWSGLPTISEDIASDPRWQDYRGVALAHGLCACWSTPFCDSQGKLLGTLALYFDQPRRPAEDELRLVDLTTHTMGIAVARQREEETLRRSEASLATAQAIAGLGNWEVDLVSGKLFWSSEMFRLYYLPPSDTAPTVEEQRKFIHPDDVAHRREAWIRLRATGTSQRYEFRTHPDLGPVRHLSAIVEPVRNEAGTVTGYVGTQLDVTARKAQEEQIERLAFYDPLTGLPHRALFIDRLQQALSIAERHGGKVALLFLDLNRFKEINDSQGHQSGDTVLVEVGHRLQAVLRQDETLARLGGDEFTVIVRETDEAGAAVVAERIQSAFTRPFSVGGRSFSLGVSIGIALYPEDGNSAHALLSRSDIAMYQAKARGGGYHFYRPEMSAQLDSRLSLAQGLERAIAESRLQLFYQPQIGLDGDRLVGAEALLRWEDPERGWISPAEFIPIAEDRGMMDILGAWVLREASRQLKSWENAGTPFGGSLAINVSAKQLGGNTFISSVRGVLDAFGISPRQIELELTESALMTDAERAVELMAQLKDMGFALAIDDFGTGYSSLIYLKRFPADKLKIDMSFVRDMLSDHNDYAIVTTIIAMARNLGLTTIAEGVESEAQAEALRSLGCEEVQGYFFGKPLPAEDFAARWLNGQG